MVQLRSNLLVFQLLCVVHMEFTNTYGSLFGFATASFFRLAGGEPLFNMDACIWYPWAEEIGKCISGSVTYLNIVSSLVPFLFIFHCGGFLSATLIFLFRWSSHAKISFQDSFNVDWTFQYHVDVTFNKLDV